MHCSNAFLKRGNLKLFETFVVFCFCAVTQIGVVVRPRKSTSFVPHWFFAMECCNPDFCISLKTACNLVKWLWGEFAAIPISSTYRAHWSAGETCSTYLGKTLENVGRDALRLCGSLRLTKCLLLKLNGSISADPFSAICIDMLGISQAHKTIFPLNVFCSICQCADEVLVVDVVVWYQVLDFLWT